MFESIEVCTDPPGKPGAKAQRCLDLVKQFRDLEQSNYNLSAPIMARLQYDFGLVALRYQMGVVPGFPIVRSGRDSLIDLFGGIVGGGLEFDVDDTLVSLVFLFQANVHSAIFADGYDSYASYYLTTLGVSW